jgi:AGZA family xanthine/uracil permease-like MFS transporter
MPDSSWQTNKPRPPFWVAGDLDGFFALFIDNLLLMILIATLCPTVCGLPLSLVFGRILPGAALSICVGNLFYGWQARRLALRTGRTDVTALPYGINTVSVITFCYYIMGPVYARTHNSDLAWKMGLFACFVAGLIELAGAFCCDWLRRNTPRAALLCPLAGIGITFLAGSFAFQIFSQPLIGMIPMLLVLIAYVGRLKLPGRIPAGFVAVAVGVAASALCQRLGWTHLAPPAVAGKIGFTPPIPVNLWGLLSASEGWQYFAVILPIGLMGVFSSVQILESAEAAGDRYATRSSMIMNGVGTICAAAFGSAFTTSIYIGHPAWKELGARSGYSTVNGVVIMLLCLCGGMSVVVHIIPMPVAMGIMLWIGLVIVAQAFQAVPRRHAPAVALGLMPGLGAWMLMFIQTGLAAAGTTLFAVAPQLVRDGFPLDGLIALSQGSMLASMILGAFSVLLVERKFLRAAGWSAVAAALAFFGVIHAGRVTPDGVVNVFGWAAAPQFTAAYLLAAAVLVACHVARQRGWLDEACREPGRGGFARRERRRRLLGRFRRSRQPARGA